MGTKGGMVTVVEVSRGCGGGRVLGSELSSTVGGFLVCLTSGAFSFAGLACCLPWMSLGWMSLFFFLSLFFLAVAVLLGWSMCWWQCEGALLGCG